MAGTPPSSVVSSGLLSYVEDIAGLTITATSDATAQTHITAPALVFDGATIIRIEYFAADANVTTAQQVIVNLYDGATDQGRWVFIGGAGISSGSFAAEPIGVRYVTPSAGSHTYSARAWKTGGTAAILAGTGGVATTLPAYLRISRA